MVSPGLLPCRAFPERVRLQLAPSSQDDRVNNACSAASSEAMVPLYQPPDVLQVATVEGRGRGGGATGTASRQAGASSNFGRLLTIATLRRLVPCAPWML